MDKKESLKSMVKTPVTSKKVGEPTRVEAKIFGRADINPQVLSQAIIGLQSNLRCARAQTKTRGNVAGSTRKPWRQKGTGRARVGSRRTPLWRGGGVIFGPSQDRNFRKKLHRKVLIPALRAVLSSQAEAGAIFEIKQLPALTAGKTKSALFALSKALDPRSNLIVLGKANPALSQALHNVAYITVVRADNLDLLDVTRARRIIFLPEALTILQARLTKSMT